MSASRLARDHGLRLATADDALAVIGSGVHCCVFTLDDLSPDFFDLRNGAAGEVFQKLINYHCLVAIVVPDDHGLGERVTELVREHARHPVVRFFPTVEAALDWADAR
ncbi:MAG: DUF4180 domain-containing protein [Pseudomonadales bacterium]